MNRELQEGLRALDPGREVPDDLHARLRARATLDAVTSGARELDEPTDAVARPGSAALLAAAAAVLLVAVGVAGGPGSPPVAYASWTPVPSSLAPVDLDYWEGYCEDRWPGHSYELRLAEQRGAWVFVVLGDSSGMDATCLGRVDGTPAGGGLEGRLSIEPPADGLTTNSVHWVPAHDSALYSVTGLAGAEVVAVTIHAGGRDIEATLENGHFAAWWPGGKPGPWRWGPPDPRVTVSLADGSTRTARMQEYDISSP